ncbi:MAG: hypothetical protein ACRD1T_26745, partial [Acidimicrobiia bacterium]
SDWVQNLFRELTVKSINVYRVVTGEPFAKECGNPRQRVGARSFDLLGFPGRASMDPAEAGLIDRGVAAPAACGSYRPATIRPSLAIHRGP